jgi:hypothetical protein
VPHPLLQHQLVVEEEGLGRLVVLLLQFRRWPAEAARKQQQQQQQQQQGRHRLLQMPLQGCSSKMLQREVCVGKGSLHAHACTSAAFWAGATAVVSGLMLFSLRPACIPCALHTLDYCVA